MLRNHSEATLQWNESSFVITLKLSEWIVISIMAFRSYVLDGKKLKDNQSSLHSVLIFSGGFWCGLLLPLAMLWVIKWWRKSIVRFVKALTNISVCPVMLHMQYAFGCERTFCLFGLRQNCFCVDGLCSQTSPTPPRFSKSFPLSFRSVVAVQTYLYLDIV